MPLDDAALERLFDLVFDHCCTLKAADFADAERIQAFADALTTAEQAARFHARMVKPARERLLARAEKSGVKLGDWLPDDAKKKLGERMSQPWPIPKKVIDELVASDKVRDEVRTTLQETLSGFVKKATTPEGTAAGLKGALGLGAKAFAQAGKGLLGGLSDEIKVRMEEKARDFVDTSVGVVQERIARKLGSADTAAALGKRRGAWFTEQLGRTEAEASAPLRKAPRDLADELAPQIVAHNARRAEVREAFLEETRAAIAELSTQTVGELLDEAGVREMLRQAFKEKGLPIARAVVKTPAFEAWWAGVKDLAGIRKPLPRPLPTVVGRGVLPAGISVTPSPLPMTMGRGAGGARFSTQGARGARFSTQGAGGRPSRRPPLS